MRLGGRKEKKKDNAETPFEAQGKLRALRLRREDAERAKTHPQTTRMCPG
jgi:hypothetical protein